MSLINNALKKAQRQRTGETTPVASGRDAQGRRGQGMSMQTMMLIGAGAAVLVAVSVMFTVYLLRSPAPSTVTPSTAVMVDQPATALPSTVPPPTAAAPAATVPPSTDTPSMVVSLPTVLTSTAPPSPLSRPSSESDGGTDAPAPAPATPSEAIYAFIDQLQVMGIRSSGSDSRVLMNDRVYRVNDIVDRTLMLKLTEVRSDRLTFVDANGVSYTKDF